MLILHDYTESTDGGSRLCFTLAKGLGVPLVLGSMQRQHPYLARYTDVQLSTLMPHVPHALVRAPLLAASFLCKTRFIRIKKVAIFSGTYAPLAVLHNPAKHNILYCHTPPRFLYDDHELFAARLPLPLRPVFRRCCQMLRNLYAAAIERMDVLITNSETVQARIHRQFGRTAQVIPPPCGDTLSASSAPLSSNLHAPATPPFYLSLSRLDPLKRVDILINAFRALPEQRLVITSSGPEEAALRRLAQDAPNITFAGMVGDSELQTLLQTCTATLCVAQNEDFGMCAAESLAFGKPVIAAGAGGLAEIVRHERTGLLLDPDPSPSAVRQAVMRLDASAATAMRDACLQRAQSFSVARFVEHMRQAIQETTGVLA